MYANAAESRIVRNQDVLGSLQDQRRFPDKLIIEKVEVSGLSRVGLPHEMLDAVSLNTNGVALEASSLTRRKAALAAMS